MNRSFYWPRIIQSCRGRVEQFLNFVGSRETLRMHLAAGATAKELYVGFDPVIARQFKERRLHKVSRNLAPFTLRLRTVAIKFLGAGAEVPISSGVGRAYIVLFGIWRVMADTLPLSVALGPLYRWSPLEKTR